MKLNQPLAVYILWGETECTHLHRVGNDELFIYFYTFRRSFISSPAIMYKLAKVVIAETVSHSNLFAYIYYHSERW